MSTSDQPRLSLFESCLEELACDRFNAECVRFAHDEWGVVQRVWIHAYRQGKQTWWVLANSHQDACLLALAHKADQLDPAWACNVALTQVGC